MEQFNIDRVQYLFSKKLSGQCSISELEELAQLTQELTNDKLISILNNQWGNYSPSEHLSTIRSRQIIQSIIGENTSPLKSTPKVRTSKVLIIQLISVAASLALFALAGNFIYQYFRPEAIQPILIKAEPLPLSKSVDFNRQQVLADGTLVVLKAGSTLQCSPQFNTTSRQVVLNGEAFFDVARDTCIPFTIHTGSVKTVVIGTTFTIKAWEYERQVTVSVSKGKVKVEDQEKTLAILSANQQIHYNQSSSNLEQVTLTSQEIVPDWTQHDLVFHGESLESIAHTLSRHFGVNIYISSSELATIQIVSSFSGIEPLENILEILCIINGDVQYSVTGNDILLSRKSPNPKSKN